MANVMTVSEARAALPQVLDRVLAGEEVTLTRHGTPVAVVIRPDSLRVRRAGEAVALAQDIQETLMEASRGELHSSPRLSEERAETLVGEVRASRSGR